MKTAFITGASQGLGREILAEFSRNGYFVIATSNRGKVELCMKDVLALLNDPVESLTDAYLTMALFITTRDPNYRDAVKAWRQSHPDTPSSFRRLYAIVKELKAKKRKKK